ncbi:MAG: FAD-binding protein [Magnetococcales bacterium]|nr:FAD-binding protein [Magnetococcales bacterium]
MNPSPLSRPPVPQPPDHFPAVLERLRRALGTDCVLSSAVERQAYGWDNTGSCHPPWAVVLASNRQQVEATLRLCQEAAIPVIPRGAGTGNVGGALAVQGGVVLSLQRLDRILEVSVADRLAVVEPGVVHADLQARLKPYGLFWPPAPSSSRSCSVGGNLAMCAAGANAVRYGVTRDWVLGLEALLADGSLFRTGGRTTKGVVGYDLTRLLIGSEGSLAVITQATLKLAPLPEAHHLLRAIFPSVAVATQGVCALMAAGESPTAIEFLDESALNLLRQEGAVSLPPTGAAMLLVELSGSAASMETMVAEMLARLAPFDCVELVHAGAEEAATLWAARYALSPVLKKLAPKRINEDVVVPVSRLPELMEGVAAISQSSQIPIVNFGHAGNGNIHVNLLVDPADAAVMAAVPATLARIFRLVLDLGGSLSGEHGIGIQKQAFLPWEVDATALQLQQRIKAAFDPRGILNPGKIFPPQNSI